MSDFCSTRYTVTYKGRVIFQMSPDVGTLTEEQIRAEALSVICGLPHIQGQVELMIERDGFVWQLR